MNWMNLRTELLRSPEFANARSGAIETWLRVMAYCCEQENGGRIAGACAWSDRGWLTTCGVTKAEIQTANPLIYDDGVDSFVTGYPCEKEAEVQAKREAGRKGGKRSGRNRASSRASSTPRTEGEGEGERKDNGKEKRNGNEPPEEHTTRGKRAGFVVPDVFAKVDGFTAALGGWIESRRKQRKPPTDRAIQLVIDRLAKTPERAVDALNTAVERGWSGVDVTWLDGRTNGKPNLDSIHDKPHSAYGF